MDVGPRQLDLELTESAIMRPGEAKAAIFRDLGSLGIGIALDDFGRGHSALSSLRRFPIDRIEIDESIVLGLPDDPERTAATAGIIAMAHHFSLAIVAEGVETIEQARSLAEFGCEELQGYLLSPPLPASEFGRFLARDEKAADDAS